MRRLKHTLCAAAAAVLSTTAGFAQTPQAAPPSAERLALAHRLVADSGGAEEVKRRLSSLFLQMSKVMTKDLPPDQARLQAAIQQDVVDELSPLIPGMIAETERSYARQLTTQELKDCIAWMESPSGQALRAKGPAIRAEVIAAEAPAFRGLAPAISRRAFARACEQMKCSDSDRKVLAGLASRQVGSSPPS